jgi:hypothetical protein
MGRTAAHGSEFPPSSRLWVINELLIISADNSNDRTD